MKNNSQYLHSYGAESTSDSPELEWRFLLHLLLGLVFFVAFFSSSSKFADLSGSDLDGLMYLHVKNTENPIEDARLRLRPAAIKTYDFNRVATTFGNIELDRVGELSKEEFEKIVLSSAPKSLRGRLKKYVGHALHFAEAYQVDPFWVIAIMWTESHFNNSARSYVNATGLMQIMPATGVYLAKKLKITSNKSKARRLTKLPKYNVHMGTYYIKYLLKTFKGSAKFATVAYNMGPGRVKWRLRTKRQVGVNNLYLTKVRRHYRKITSGFKAYTTKNPRPFKKTYVALNRISDIKKSSTKYSVDSISSLYQL